MYFLFSLKMKRYAKSQDYYPMKKNYTKMQVKRYSRKPKINRSLDTLYSKIEYVTTIGYASGGNVQLFSATSANYLNFETVMSNSISWTDVYAFWQRYKITGMACRVGRIFNENSITTPLSNESPNPLYIASYPNLTTGNAGSNPLYNDKSFRVDPYVTGVQSHYWKYPDNFLDVTQGIGVNNQCNTYGNQVGQISVYSAPLTNVTTAAVLTFEVRVCLYVTFKDRNE
jgi:hypothetical protein